jgi:hypothetical protein
VNRTRTATSHHRRFEKVEPQPMSRPSRVSSVRGPLAVACLAAMLLTAAVSLGAAPPAHADDSNGTSLGLVTVTPATGKWTDDSTAVKMGGTYTCPKGVGPNDQVWSQVFIAERGHEAPTVTADTPMSPTNLYPIAGNANSTIDGSGGTFQDQEYVFPLLDASQTTNTWTPAGGSMFTSAQAFIDSLDSSKSYSLVVACGMFRPTDGSPVFLPDASGHVPAAWADLTLSADKTGWTISAPKASSTVTTVGLVASAGAGSATLTATVQAAGATATSATGTVEFHTGDTPVVSAPVVNGIGSFTVSGLTAGHSYAYTAVYVPDAASTFGTSTSTAQSVTPTAAAVVPGAELAAGTAMVAGTAYKVTVPAATFTAGDTVTGVIHSDPITLTETSTVAGDGSTVFAFTAPTGVPAGDHQLILSDAHSKTSTTAFTVAAAADPTTTPPATATAGTGVSAGTDPSAGNSPVSFATDWVGGMASTPMGVAALFGLLVAAVAAAVGGWLYFWRQRGRVTTAK